MDHTEPSRNEEAERIVLGTLMHHPTAHADAAAILDRADFYLPPHQLIWDVITERVAEGKSIAPAALVSAIQRIGQGNLIRNGDLIWEISGSDFTGGTITEFATLVREAAEVRNDTGLATSIQLAANNGASSDQITNLISGHLDAKRERATRTTASGSILNWDSFFATDFSSTELLVGRIMGEGQQIALVGDGKAGKSLFCQDWAWRLGTGQSFLGDRGHAPVRVLYLDAENGQDEVQRRYNALGAGPGRMGELRYASFPPIPPLDTAAGGLALMAMVQETNAEMVFIDTVSRFISGPENDSDTWLSLYRYSLMPLKRARIASVRLDHFGKDKERGSRGSSAKTQDVDHVWELTGQGDNLLTLKRTHTRTGIGEDLFAIQRQFQKRGTEYVAGATRHVLAGGAFGEVILPGSVQDIAQRLDAAGVPSDYGRERLREETAKLGIKAANNVLAEVVRYRKHHAQIGTSHLSANLSPAVNTPTVPASRTAEDIPADQTCPGQVEDRHGQASSTPVPSALPLRRGQVGTARPGQPICTTCNEPLEADWASRGYDTHVICQPAS